MEVHITTAGRLHLGFMDLNGSLGRLYGSIGVSLSGPQTEISVKTHGHLSFEGGDGHLEKRIFGYVKAFSDHYHVEPRVKIRVHQRIPEHRGLGSGSQMALALGTSLAKVYDIHAAAYDLSMIMGRGLRSGIGISSFETGGLIIDSGKKRQGDGVVVSEPPKTVMRFDFPDPWRFVVVIPEEKQGLSGEQEKKAMGFVSPSKKTSEKICRLVMMRLLPSLAEQDIQGFGRALSELDRKTGMFFRPVQGGLYNEKHSYRLIDHMLASGAYGAGQSSWGPAVYGLSLKQESDAVADRMNDFLMRQNIQGNVLIASGRNRGAAVEVLEPGPREVKPP